MTDDLVGLFHLLIKKYGGADRLIEDIDTEWLKGKPTSVRRERRKRKKIKSPWSKQWQTDLIITKYMVTTNKQLAEMVELSKVQLTSRVWYLRSIGAIVGAKPIHLRDREFYDRNNKKNHNKQ